MMNKTTLNKLHEMKLSAMADAYRLQVQDAALRELNFEERFGLMVDAEWTRRKNNHLNRLLKHASLHFPGAAVEDIEYYPDRKLDKTQITTLATCNYIGECHNIIILGASGAGKTYLACAFGVAACRNFYPAKYVRLPELLDELAIARGEGNYRTIMKQYKKVRLLILDEWLLTPLNSVSARDLLEIVEARHKRGSTIFSSQFSPAGWHVKIGEDTLADAILDRIIHDSYTLLIDGQDSMRKRKGIPGES